MSYKPVSKLMYIFSSLSVEVGRDMICIAVRILFSFLSSRSCELSSAADGVSICQQVI